VKILPSFVEEEGEKMAIAKKEQCVADSALHTHFLFHRERRLKEKDERMILPAKLQILVHSSLLVWTAYYMIIRPSFLLNSTLVVIFGEAMKLVFSSP
jgi:hypothetical protein